MDIDDGNHDFPGSNTPGIHTLQQQLSELKSTEDNLNCKKQELQGELEVVQKHIDATHNAVTTKQAQINERQNSFKPIVSLPAEILSLIFLHVVSLLHGNIQVTPYPMPLVLSSVCRRWRSVVFWNPRLWAHITLEHSSRHNLELYLTRSGDSGLDISFAGKWHARTEALVRQLGNEAPRWRRLHMDVTDASKGLLPLPSQKRAKSLTSIHLVNRTPHRSAPVSPAFAAYQNHLETVTLIHVPIFKALVAPRLQHFTFVGGWDDDCMADRLWRILSSATHLRTLRLGADSLAFNEATRRPCQLPHLEHLTLYFDEDPDTEQLIDLFDMIAAPSLQVIEFTALPELCISNWELVPCIKQKYPLVTTAVLYNVICHNREVPWFIKCFPHVKNLTLDVHGLLSCSTALGELDQSPNADCWDTLEFIRVRMPPNLLDAIGMDMLCDWLERRHTMGFPKLKLELVMNQAQDPQDEDRWEWLDPLSEWSVMTVVKPSDDVDAPWNFLANYKGQGN